MTNEKLFFMGTILSELIMCVLLDAILEFSFGPLSLQIFCNMSC